MIRFFFIFIIVSFGFFHVVIQSNEDDLWCYTCNTDLGQGHKGYCNDPYSSAAVDLVACPRNESHHCLKSIVLYRNILVTIRGCVSSRRVNGYCDYEDSFPRSSIECYFCKENGCNNKESLGPMSKWYLGVLAIILSRI
ncbi:uncharacterized protein LOC109863002 isoform X2 [Pseudomyrmex gracilis]|uniref:uncharacterized protein LOC109863002 isoform X2 n=1 Tax=Pseudomyrmex gracilis TaxID=219809 RepID=UPI000994DBF8|nr:uncharacterized protein LOC109863002 isoform X2 [Pseudomyrmex gracilis]XP_020298778.1 uncharacterized protein LOC109863002 isoform X2 [Pseudomyrmex gracilis]